MTNGQLASFVINKLEHIYGLREARAIQRYLFSFLLDRSTADWLMIRDEKADEELEGIILSLLPELMANKPVQYVLGKSWFCDFEFKVTPDVLIPRPETEELVLMISQELKNSQPISILDIGTGSGIIAIALAKLIPGSEVAALDISPSALDVAKINAAHHNVEIDFIECDILSYDNGMQVPDIFQGREFNLIVSNPPYVKRSEALFMHENVLRFEPHNALFVRDEDPLIFYRSIVRFAELHLANNGYLYMEINENEGSNMINLLEIHGYSNISLLSDLNGKPRFIKGIKN